MKNANEFQDLLDGTRTWGTAYSQYDIVGVLNLLAGCLSNLASNCSPEDIAPESIAEVFSPEEIAVMKDLVRIYVENGDGED